MHARAQERLPLERAKCASEGGTSSSKAAAKNRLISTSRTVFFDAIKYIQLSLQASFVGELVEAFCSVRPATQIVEQVLRGSTKRH